MQKEKKFFVADKGDEDALNSEIFKTIVENVSPHITLSRVLDDDGNILFHFRFHPQMDEITLEIENLNDRAYLTPDNVRDFAETLEEFANTAEYVVSAYNEGIKDREIVL